MADRKTLLLVDDTPDNLAHLNALLRGPYKTKIATNGEKALKIAFADNPPDLILLDIMMPEMDGYEVCERLQADDRTREIPVIFLTAKIQMEDEKRGLEIGAVDYITKPISPPILLARIETHLRLKQALDDLKMEIKERIQAQAKEAQAHAKLKEAHAVISDSIAYASRIQRSILPHETIFADYFKDYFILWEPRDVVGGDIYWAGAWGRGAVFVLGDCTGHGVPGAFMSLITTGAMGRALVEQEAGDCSGFLQHIHRVVQTTLGQNGTHGEADDGMELGVCYIAPDKNQLVFAGARLELYVIGNGEVSVAEPTKKGIGYRGISFDQTYTEHRIDTAGGQRFYLTSDGLIDQVGLIAGGRRRMFGKKRFKQLLLSTRDKPMSAQKKAISQALLDHQGTETRRDDVSVIGFRFDAADTM